MNHEIRKKIARFVHAYMSGAGSESAVLQRQHEEIPLEPVLVRRMSAQILAEVAESHHVATQKYAFHEYEHIADIQLAIYVMAAEIQFRDAVMILRNVRKCEHDAHAKQNLTGLLHANRKAILDRLKLINFVDARGDPNIKYSGSRVRRLSRAISFGRDDIKIQIRDRFGVFDMSWLDDEKKNGMEKWV
ncbi:hypothetical protein D2T31_20260 [Sinirhodobacter populi]|uniref:Uncharacterized protein n=1 Tax=Paenirhodobacter populi TaxID=2306993 RepID=A0A443K0P0_9RHOB|nr:hypothetical protein [Sinirhodobacter populi]RWR26360.1 hypothetical protein D2T31_20260 [Sinirhodobacter populi]